MESTVLGRGSFAVLGRFAHGPDEHRDPAEEGFSSSNIIFTTGGRWRFHGHAGRIFALLRTSMQATPQAGALIAAPLLAAGGVSLAIVVAAALVGAPAVAALTSGVLAQAERGSVQ
jgi:hypothetical protein